MTKRASGKFERREADFYPTPFPAVVPLIPHLHRTGVLRFAEPCVGAGDLIRHLEGAHLTCVASGDLNLDNCIDARSWAPEDLNHADAVVTNPPWERYAMAGIMEHFSYFTAGWYLIYSDWLFTKQSAVLMRDRCTDVVPIGRIKWIPNSPSVGFDNCCWVRMSPYKQTETVLWPMTV
jgi:hypothetical protein